MHTAGDASEIFSSVHGFAAERARYHSYFNAGVMMLTPSQETYDGLIALGGQVCRCTTRTHSHTHLF